MTTWLELMRIDIRPCQHTYFAAFQFHERCLRELVREFLPLELPCRQCNSTLPIATIIECWDQDGPRQGHCPECGTERPLLVRYCSECHIPIPPASHHYRYGYSHGEGWMHVACLKRRLRRCIEANQSLDVSIGFGSPSMNLLYDTTEFDGASPIQRNHLDRARNFLPELIETARELRRPELCLFQAKQQIKTFWGNDMHPRDVRTKSLEVRNLSGHDRSRAEDLQSLGCTVSVRNDPRGAVSVILSLRQ